MVKLEHQAEPVLKAAQRALGVSDKDLEGIEKQIEVVGEELEEEVEEEVGKEGAAEVEKDLGLSKEDEAIIGEVVDDI